jgi:hypothetical protein
MTDVIHDPATDWCACPPNGDVVCDYRLLADAVEDELNPADGDESEVSLCIGAVKRIAEFVRSLPCSCTPEGVADGEPCGRCAALGQAAGELVPR